MKFAVPITTLPNIYPNNPCTAPQFAIYSVHYIAKEVHYAFVRTVANPWRNEDGTFGCDLQAINGECSIEAQNDLSHMSEHYAMLEAINGCSYLLVQSYCENTRRAMRNAGVKLFQIPPFCKTLEQAVSNFLIGAKLAEHSGQIRAVS